MNWPLIVLVGSQLLFSSGDLLARTYMRKYGFSVSAFLSLWFAVYFTIRTVAMFGQLYVFTTVQLGKTMALFGAVSIVLSNILGLLVLKEVLSPVSYAAVALAIAAFMIMALK
jgi:multidrug transporter EmrE-like cation transporter